MFDASFFVTVDLKGSLVMGKELLISGWSYKLSISRDYFFGSSAIFFGSAFSGEGSSLFI